MTAAAVRRRRYYHYHMVQCSGFRIPDFMLVSVTTPAKQIISFMARHNTKVSLAYHTIFLDMSVHHRPVFIKG